MSEQPAIPEPYFELGSVPLERAVLHLKAWTRRPAALPDLGLRAGSELRSLGPAEWLLISDVFGGPVLLAAVARLTRELGIVAVDVSHGMAGLRLRGEGVRDVLSQGSGLDLHPRAFPVGSCTRTRLAQLPVVIDHLDPAKIDVEALLPCYELYVGASYRAYLKAWLEDASAACSGAPLSTG
jgi:sarcosine oxidase subunit gamma